MHSFAAKRRNSPWLKALLCGGVALAAVLSPVRTSQAQPYDCLSPDPSMWPPPAKPYFMLIVDTSGSMIGCTNPSSSGYQWPDSCPSTAPKNSCNMEPTRLNDAKCALRQTVQAFAGEVNFGLSTFAVHLSGCSNGVVPDSCTASNGNCNPPNALGTEGEFYSANGCTVSPFPDYVSGDGQSCGNWPRCNPGAGPPAPNLAENSWRNGGNIVVDMLRDSSPPGPSNVSTLLEWFDGRTDNSREIFALGGTPTGGALRSVQQYFLSGWNPVWDHDNYCASGFSTTSPTPMTSGDPACRNLNVLLVTDGDANCGSGNNQAGAVAAATAMFGTGVTFGGKNYKIKTHVIGFAGANKTNTDAIAAAGGTTTSLVASNEVELAQALANIIAGAIKPETCNNADDNCNTCIDEGYGHFCNTGTGKVCCAWSNTTQRNACLTNYQASITSGNPQGNLDLLPCTTVPQSQNPATWLCYDPKEICDNIDNNCNGQTDEGFTKCGSPLHCPLPETCNGLDDNCDGIIDNSAGSGVPYSACPGGCTPSAEICDGCDNDCDGFADEGIADIPCGFSPPANCAGVRHCQHAGPAPGYPGTNVGVGNCITSGPKGFGSCQFSTQSEICDGLDNNCNGTIDEGIPPVPCTPNPALKYKEDGFPNSQCTKGVLPCNGTCTGGTGPSLEVCDGIDNDCDGQVDEGVPNLGAACGLATGQCKKGVTACVGGVVICQGGTPPQPESCNGLDDDCDGTSDNAPLTDQPAAPGCWTEPAGGCSPACSHQNLTWCPPAGGTCQGTGTLTSPCQTGTLVCDGANKWKCQGGTKPITEVCDGADNNCNGQKDESLGPPIGVACGSDVGECKKGLNVCDNGTIKCNGGQGPVTELCNGKDDDCDGTIDNGIPLGGACNATYDTNAYPGDRTKGQCKPGVTACDGNGGQICNGGVGPSPEVCDGIDNDCDGQIDEPGPAPDGINGTEDPLQPGTKIGDACGVNKGECKQGQWICDKGKFACGGGIGPSPEQCDCLDNDCDGVVDNGNPAPGPLLCNPGKTCVELQAGLCQCAEPCGSGEFPCPTGSLCKQVKKSGTQTNAGDFCVSDNCGDCSTKTVKDPTTGNVLCAPKGSAGTLPECLCKGNKCVHPCDGIQCSTGQECALQGPAAGTCQPTGNCFFFGCPDGQLCNGGLCVGDPCSPNPCPAGEACKPNTTFDAPRCVGSCASVSCQAGEVCFEGQCTATGCGTDCPSGQVCQGDGDGGFGCGPDKCVTEGGLPCADGSFCNPATGACGNDPCEGVVCPDAQECVAGECSWAPEAGTGGAGGGSGTGGSGATGGNSDAGLGGSGNNGTGAGTSGTPEKGAWGLATGGGGCACRTGTPERIPPLGIALLGAAFALAASRRRKKLNGKRPVDSLIEGDRS